MKIEDIGRARRAVGVFICFVLLTTADICAGAEVFRIVLLPDTQHYCEMVDNF